MGNIILRYGGIGLMAIGSLVILCSFPTISQFVVSLGLTKSGIYEISSARMIIGVMLVALGFFSYTRTWDSFIRIEHQIEE